MPQSQPFAGIKRTFKRCITRTPRCFLADNCGLASLADASRLLNPTSIMVGLSGGLDSSLLLTLLCDLRARGELTLPLRAIHINHGLQEAADKWQLHCETLCAQHGVNLSVCVVDCSLNSAGATAERKVGESAVVQRGSSAACALCSV